MAYGGFRVSREARDKVLSENIGEHFFRILFYAFLAFQHIRSLFKETEEKERIVSPLE